MAGQLNDKRVRVCNKISVRCDNNSRPESELTVKERVAADGAVLVLQARLWHSVQLGKELVRDTLDFPGRILRLLHQLLDHLS